MPMGIARFFNFPGDSFNAAEAYLYGMKRHLLWSTLFVIVSLLYGFSCSNSRKLSAGPVKEQTSSYQYFVNIRDIENDELQITLVPPRLEEDSLIFQFPRIVPGIYGYMDFGKNISEFKATDASGAPLPVKKRDPSTYILHEARKLRQITYRVADGWDEFDTKVQPGFYRSAESCFKVGEVLVVNNNTLFGYFRGYENLGYEIEYKKPTYWYGATQLPVVQAVAERVQYRADNYRHLVDHPILFSQPDTAIIQLEDITVTVACFSTTYKKIAKEIAPFIKPLLQNQKAYLGNQLPVKSYTFLLYHNLSDNENSYSADGLEHGTSTLILLSMPLNTEVIRQNIYGVASHEFFHILMPLSLHSEQIAKYDFYQPAMSKHLWLYEGMTEYFSMHMPVKQGAFTLEQFLETVEHKYRSMLRFDNKISMTQLSKAALEKQDQYYNFYLKGALISMCLDIQLRELSEGKYGVQQLILDLVKQHGPNKAFDDNQLFELIAKASDQPPTLEFFRKYVEGTEPLPLASYLSRAGIQLDEKKLKIGLVEKPTAMQLQLRKAWLGQ